MLVTASLDQLVTGYPVCEHRCSRCEASLQEGNPVRTYVIQYAGDNHWPVPRLYCRECRPDDSPQ